MSVKLVFLLLAAVCLHVTSGNYYGGGGYGGGFGGGAGFIGGGFGRGFGRIWCTCRRWWCHPHEFTFSKHCVLFPIFPKQWNTCCKWLPWWATDFYRGGYGGIGGGGFGGGFIGGGLGIGGGAGGKAY